MDFLVDLDGLLELLPPARECSGVILLQMFPPEFLVAFVAQGRIHVKVGRVAGNRVHRHAGCPSLDLAQALE